jgi:DNA-binding CsgD family transcriptional regulator
MAVSGSGGHLGDQLLETPLACLGDALAGLVRFLRGCHARLERGHHVDDLPWFTGRGRELELLPCRLLADEVEDLAQPEPTRPDETARWAEALGLTPREVDVLGLVARGYTNREIANALFISDKTASVHVSNILRKLDVPNRREAAALAHRLATTTPHAPAPPTGST